jgi:hypothetical protein
MLILVFLTHSMQSLAELIYAHPDGLKYRIQVLQLAKSRATKIDGSVADCVGQSVNGEFAALNL